jgi:hypothetical protein
MKNKTLHNAFPIVAAAIGNRFGIKVSVGGDKAYTNGKSIYLPAYDGNDPDYQDYAWGLLAHEAAHIRYSDFSIDFGKSVLRRRLSGAIEDVRIEHELMKDYPGTRLTLRTVIEKMIVKGGFIANRVDEHPANILYGYVLKSLRARVLGQVVLAPLVDQTEAVLAATFSKNVVIQLKDLLSEVPDNLSSEMDCLHLADRILAMIEQEVEQSQQQQNNHSSESSDTEENNAENAGNDDRADSDNSNDQTESEPTDQWDDSMEAADATDTGNSESCEDNALSVPDIEPEVVNSAETNTEVGIETEANDHRQIMDALLAADDSDIDQDVFDTIKSTLALAQRAVCDHVMPMGNEPFLDEPSGIALFNKVQSESVKIRAALQGLVQSQRLKRTQHSNRGRRIDGKRLSQVSFGNTHIFHSQVAKPSPNTAIHLLIDKSESMGYQIYDSQRKPMWTTRMPIALEASLALALALEGLHGVNPGVTAFPGGDETSVYRLLEHGQRVIQRAGAFALSASGTTPMTEAIWFGAASLLRCREPRKVLMVMTDGQPDDQLSTLEILKRCRDSGIETIGIGLGIEVSHLFSVSIAINDFRELRHQLFALSKSVLLAA